MKLTTDILEIYDDNGDYGIKTRKVTQGSEFDLVKNFIEYRKEQFTPKSNNKLAIFIEPKVNSNYPDIVFVEYNPDGYTEWNTLRSNLTTFDYIILNYIYNNVDVGAKKINKGLGHSWKDIVISIEKLYDADLITRKFGSWCVKDKNSFAINKIEAVEAKMSGFTKVFQQALLNKTFASESSVLMNKYTKENRKNINKYIDFGIGLYTKREDGFDTINKSNHEDFPVSYYSLFFNEWMGKILAE